MKEIWRPVKGYTGFYEVSNIGRIRSVVRMAWTGENLCTYRPYGGKILSPSPNACGRPQVTLSKRGASHPKQICSMVLEAFGRKRPSKKHQCAHFDGDPFNNNINNLRWATAAENAADRERHGRTARGSRSGQAKIDEDAVRVIRTANIDNYLLAKRFSLSVDRISEIKSRRRNCWSHV